MVDLVLEKVIKASEPKGPKVTSKDLDDNIACTEVVKHVSPSGQILRWGVITTKSGFSVTGSPSVCVSSVNDIPEYGETLAIENARNALWPLMGYALKEKLLGK